MKVTRCIFFSTDLTLAALDIISGYGLRFKIEFSFKRALRVRGVHSYHLWTRGTQRMHRQTERYRNCVRRKLSAYDRHIQIGLIAQGLPQYLSAAHAPVWSSVGSWLRTIRDGGCRAELVTTIALRNTLRRFPRILCRFNIHEIPACQHRSRPCQPAAALPIG